MTSGLHLMNDTVIPGILQIPQVMPEKKSVHGYQSRYFSVFLKKNPIVACNSHENGQ